VKRAACAALLFTLVVSAFAQQTSPAGAIEAEQKWNGCILARDVACAERFLAPDYELAIAEPGRPLGEVRRAEWLATLPDYRISEMHIGEKLVRMYGDTAVVSYPYHQQAISRGRDLTGDLLITDVWVKHQDQWQVSLRLSSRFFKSGPAVNP
jgi:ketosteroid isomerase-like protein